MSETVEHILQHVKVREPPPLPLGCEGRIVASRSPVHAPASEGDRQTDSTGDRRERPGDHGPRRDRRPRVLVEDIGCGSDERGVLPQHEQCAEHQTFSRAKLHRNAEYGGALSE